MAFRVRTPGERTAALEAVRQRVASLTPEQRATESQRRADAGAVVEPLAIPPGSGTSPVSASTASVQPAATEGFDHNICWTSLLREQYERTNNLCAGMLELGMPAGLEWSVPPDHVRE